jgi:uncharacterized membrane protein
LPSNTILAVSLFFHLFATVIWVGGLLITVLLVWPEVRRTLMDSPAIYNLLNRLRQRFTPWGNLALVVLIFTGLIQMSLDPNYEGVLDFSNTWSQVILAKHVAIVFMIVCGALLQFGVTPALERTSLLIQKGKGDVSQTTEAWDRLRRRETRLTWINALLGVAVLAFSAWAGTL